MAKFGFGQPMRRTEDARFLVGRGQYTDDIALPGQFQFEQFITARRPRRRRRPWSPCPRPCLKTGN